MTKARLHAEASEKPINDSVPRRADTEQFGNSMTTVSNSLDYHDQQLSRSHMHTSPVPGIFQGFRNANLNRRMVETRDAWETASVSTSTSDFPTSDSVYSVVNGHDEASYTLNGSYATNGFGNENDAAPLSFVLAGPSGYSETNMGPNRRRATTLSPRPGSLFNLHEDRPLAGNHLSFVQQPQSINHTSSNRHRLGSDTGPVVCRGRTPSAHEHLGPDTTVFGTANVEISNHQYEGNRSRTSSFMSLPSTPYSSEDLFNENNACNVSMTQRFTNQFQMVEEDLPSQNVAGLSAVFRPTPEVVELQGGFDDRFCDSTLSSLGLGSSNSFVANPSGDVAIRKRAETDFLQTAVAGFNANNNFDRAPGSTDSRLRAATWGEPTLDMFGMRMFGNAINHQGAADDRLADDLASILKLSGSEQSDTLFAPPGF